MKGKIRSLNEALPDLMLGIFLFGIVCEVIGLLLIKDKMIYAISLAIGILLAEAMAYHMAWALDKAVDFGSGSAEKMILKHNMIRYAMVVVVFAMILLSATLNPVYAFLGLLGLKVGAYIQPFTHKLITKIKTLKTRR